MKKIKNMKQLNKNENEMIVVHKQVNDVQHSSEIRKQQKRDEDT